MRVLHYAAKLAVFALVMMSFGSACGGDDGGTRALESRGFRAVRWGAEMLRPDLEAIDDVPLAEGYTIRTPTEAELPAVFAMAVEAFAEHWGESEAGEQRLDEWTGDPAFRLDLVVVAWNGDEPAAAVTNLIETLDDGSVRGLDVFGAGRCPGRVRPPHGHAPRPRGVALDGVERARSGWSWTPRRPGWSRARPRGGRDRPRRAAWRCDPRGEAAKDKDRTLVSPLLFWRRGFFCCRCRRSRKPTPPWPGAACS